MTRVLPLLTAIVLISLTGLVHARWSPRGADTKTLRDAVARLGRIPATLGEWTGEPAEFDGRGLERTGIAGLAARRYVSRRTGDSVTILLVCGRTGPIAVHSPEACYSGAGYEQSTPTTKCNLGGGEFYMGHFGKAGPVAGPLLRIYWAWSIGGPWRAPANPRIEYANYKILYKLYFICDAVPPADRDPNDPCQEFSKELLGELRRVVSASG
jgi:hypothetical protein